MNTRFPVLSVVSVLLRVLGWLAVAAGICFAIYEGVIEANVNDFGDAKQILSGVLFCLAGLVSVALGEVVGVLFAIEDNTGATSSAMAEVAKKGTA